MKRSKQCPKCQSRQVGCALVDIGSVQTVCIGEDVATERWACTECGYFESYVKEPRQLIRFRSFRLANPLPPDDGPFR